MLKNLDIEEAHQIIFKNIKRLPVENIPVLEARGRILAEEIEAEINLPAQSQSAVDGFALGNAAGEAGGRFEIVGYCQLGDCPSQKLNDYEAMGVMTGGILPPGTAAVIPHEKVMIKDKYLIASGEVKPGDNIKQVGEDFRKGELLTKTGELVGAGHISLFTAFNFSTLPVYTRPKVAILGMGKNIIAPGQTLMPGQQADINGPLLSSYIADIGAEVIACTVISQYSNSEFLKEYLQKIAADADLVVLTGGSYAEHEGETLALLRSVGASIQYWGTTIQPGGHNGFALLNSIPIFVLSGNPAACAVGFHLFVAPTLRYLQGREFGLKRVEAICTNRLMKKVRSRRLVRGYAAPTRKGWEVTVLPGQKPSMVKSLINCNALIDILPGNLKLEPGSPVNLILI